MIVVSVAPTAATATAAAATTTTLCADMLVKLGRTFTCVDVTMWQMLRKRE